MPCTVECDWVTVEYPCETCEGLGWWTGEFPCPDCGGAGSWLYEGPGGLIPEDA